MLISIGLRLVEIFFGINESNEREGGLLVNLYQLAVVIPSIAVCVRRMHDVNRSGWFMLVPIYGLLLTIRPGIKGNNQYEPDPIEVVSS